MHQIDDIPVIALHKRVGREHLTDTRHRAPHNIFALIRVIVQHTVLYLNIIDLLNTEFFHAVGKRQQDLLSCSLRLTRLMALVSFIANV